MLDNDRSTAIVPMGNMSQLDQWTGGFNFSEEIAYLPERLEWDKKSGGWKCETFESNGLPDVKLVAATTLWAQWSERVGQPNDLQVGVRPDGPGYDMGLRLIIEIEDFLYYWDAFGVTFKCAQSAVRRAHSQGGYFTFEGQKTITTRFGPFVIPTLSKINEGE